MKYITKLQLRYCDFDGQRIVNNAAIFSLMENAHLLFFQNIIGDNWNWSNVPLVLSKINVVYLRKISTKDDLIAEISVKRLEDSYVILKIKLLLDEDTLYCIGELKLVHFNFELNTVVSWDSYIYKLLSDK